MRLVMLLSANLLKIILISVCLCFPAVSNSKTKQTGVVLEYNGKKDKTPLGGVSLQMEGASSTLSDIGGKFSLDFPQLKAGDYIKEFKIDKPGFEVFNTDVLARLVVSPKLPWEIVMRNSAEFQKHKATLRDNSSDLYKRKFDAAREELDKLRLERKIMEAEYVQQLNELSANYLKQLNNLDNYIEHIAHIDLRQISEEEQKIVDMVNVGQMEEAVAMYEEMDYVGKYKENMAELLKMKKINDAFRTKKDASGKYLKGIENNINALMLAGGLENTRKALALYESIVQTDGLEVNVDWLLKTGNFVFTYFADQEKALAYFKQAESEAENQYGWDSFEKARALINIGNVEIAQGKFSAAVWNLNRAKRIITELYSSDHPMMATIYNNLGIANYNEGHYDTAKSNYDDALRILDRSDSLNLKNRVSIMINRANCYAAKGNYPTFFDKCIEVLDLIDDKPDDLDQMVIAGIWNNVGNAYFNSKRDDLALKYHHAALDKYVSVVGVYHPDVADVCFNIGKVHFSKGEYNDALDYFDRSLNIESNLVTMRDASRVGDLYNCIGKTYEMMDDRDNAVDSYKNGLRILEINGEDVDGDRADLYKFVAQYHCDRNDWISAVDMLCKELDVRKELLEIQAVRDDEIKRKEAMRNKNLRILADMITPPKKRDLKVHEQEPLAPLYERIADIYYAHIDGEESLQKAKKYYNTSLRIYKSIQPRGKYEVEVKKISSILERIEEELK